LKPEDVLKSIEETAANKRLPIIGPKRGLFLDEVVKDHNPRTILEVGTLVGYSAIRMARLMRKEGRIICVEVNEEMAKVARSNIERAGLTDMIKVEVGDAKEILPALTDGLDMVFLDAVKEEYISYLKSCERLLHQGSVVVADNVKSHASEVTDYLEYVRKSGKYRSIYKEAPSNYRYGAGVAEGDAMEVSVKL
jgi:caffeoyl-CoA O-methyltransferase